MDSKAEGIFQRMERDAGRIIVSQQYTWKSPIDITVWSLKFQEPRNKYIPPNVSHCQYGCYAFALGHLGFVKDGGEIDRFTRGRISILWSIHAALDASCSVYSVHTSLGNDYGQRLN